MPPHCDSLDGPVVTAARQALDAVDVARVLPYVPAAGEAEVRALFDRVVPVRSLGREAADLADRLFFETVVRIHRAGEGAAYTGLKPAGLDVGPAIPLAERALAEASAGPLVDFLSDLIRTEVAHRLERVRSLDLARDGGVAGGRSWVEAMLGFEVYAHHVYKAITAAGDAHRGGGGGSHADPPGE